MDDTVRFEVWVTLADQVALNCLLLDEPKRRRRRLLRRAAIVLLVPTVGQWLGVSLGWLSDRQQTYGAMLAMVWREEGGTLRWTVPLLSGILLALFVLQRATRVPWLRWQLRKLLRERPGVDPADPALTEHAACTLGPEGFTSDGVASHIRLGWPALKSLEESAALIIIRTGSGSGFVVPKRDLGPGVAEAIRAAFLRYGAR